MSCFKKGEMLEHIQTKNTTHYNKFLSLSCLTYPHSEKELWSKRQANCFDWLEGLFVLRAINFLRAFSFKSFCDRTRVSRCPCSLNLIKHEITCQERKNKTWRKPNFLLCEFFFGLLFIFIYFYYKLHKIRQTRYTKGWLTWKLCRFDDHRDKKIRKIWNDEKNLIYCH